MVVLLTLWSLVTEMAPFLLLGFLFAGILHVFVPKTLYTNYLSKNDFRSVVLAALFGVPLPLCSCGVIPTAMSLRKDGVSRGAVTSFLIATPQTGVDSIMATYSVFGLPFAIIRPVAAFCTALFGGHLVNVFVHDDDKCRVSGDVVCDCEKKNNHKLVEVFKYGFVTMLQDVGKWLILGLLIAGLITIIVPDSFFSQFADMPILNMIIVLAFSIPMYLCATGSIPIAAALMLKGLTPGAALVLLMAGPATNVASLLVVNKVMGKKNLLVYLASIICGAVAFGLVIDYLLPIEWFNVEKMTAICCSTEKIPLLKIISSVVFILLIVNALILKYVKTDKKILTMENTKTYHVAGMSCNHCKMSVEKALGKLEDVESVEVNLASGEVKVVGNVTDSKVKEVVEDLGFEVK